MPMLLSDRAGRFRAVLAATCAALTCESPQAPELCGSIPQQMITVGESASVTACFEDPGRGMLGYSVWSSNPEVATATGSGATVTVTAVSPGNSLVTILARNRHRLGAQQNFRVLVPNRPPIPVGGIAEREVMVGDSVTVRVADHFSEPDGQVLIYTVMTDTSVAKASVSDAEVTIVAVGKGTAAITVTATDPGGLSARQSFVVTVPNRPPVAEGTVPPQTIEVGDSTREDIARFFSDPDGDPLIYTAVTSDTTVLATTVTNSLVTVTAVAKGEATVTVTATDTEGLEATQSFGVMVPNRPPVVADSIPARTVNVGETAAVSVTPYFNDPDGDSLAFTPVTRDRAVAVAWAMADSVMVTAIARGNTTIKVTAADTEGLTAEQDFAVMVPNRAPLAVGMIPAQTVQVDSSARLEVTPYFSDPDGDTLSLHVASSDPGVAMVTAVGGSVTVVGVAKGEVTVTVTATDTGQLSATHTFAVRVPNRPPLVAREIPDQSILRGDSVLLDLTDYFGDPDGDPLDFQPRSSSSGVVTVSVTEGVATLSGRARGTATVTITARDPERLSAEQPFEVMVTAPNTAPTVTAAISSRSLTPGGRFSVDLDNHFTDPDADPLRFSVGSSDDRVATADIAGSTLTVEAVGIGTAVLTVTARDPSADSATMRFSVAVEGTVFPNRAPRIIAQLPDRTIEPDSSFSADLLGHFGDPDNDPLRFEASSTDEGVAIGDVSGTTLTVSAVSEGTTTVTVTARDPGNLAANLSFRVTVEQRGTVNRRPTVTRVIASQTLEVDEAFGTDLNGHFSDPDSDALDFTASSTNSGVATVEVSGTTLTVSAVSVGSAAISVSAEDPGGMSAALEFDVTVRPPPPPNRAPVLVDEIPDRVWVKGRSQPVQGRRYFEDPDNDYLTFSGASSNTAVATIDQQSDDYFEVVAVSNGQATITVTARDPGGLTADGSYLFTVGNTPPRIKSTPPSLSPSVGKTDTVIANQVFEDTDGGDQLRHSTSSSNTQVATSTIVFHPILGDFAAVTGVGTGQATVTMTATDRGGLSTAVSFDVFVGTNQPPTITNRIPILVRLTLTDTVSFVLSDHFEDPEGGDLSYSAQLLDQVNRVAVEISTDTLFVIGTSVGLSRVGVTAENDVGLTTEQRFWAEVSAQSSSASLQSRPASSYSSPAPASGVQSMTTTERARSFWFMAARESRRRTGSRGAGR